jgi:integrase
MPVTRVRYQEGSLKLKARKGRCAVWVYRWRELDSEGRRVQKKKIIGDEKRFPTETAAKRAVEPLRAEINAHNAVIGEMTFAELWGHFAANELHRAEADRSPTTIALYLNNARIYLLPEWGRMPISKIKTVAVEAWLTGLKGKDRRRADGSVKPGQNLAPSTKAKLRNQMCALYSHAIRHELYDRNPISGTAITQNGVRGSGGVRVSTKRLRTPDVLSIDEMQAIIDRLKSPILIVAVKVAAVTGLRRSEIRGLKWSSLDVPNLWLNVERGIVGTIETKTKTKASRRGVPVTTELAHVLLEWREQSLYRADDDWMFASEQNGGKTPIWLDVALGRHIRPAAEAAGIKKRIGWHTFRRSLATIVAAKTKDIKVAQELLRHANSSVTADLYAQGDVEAQRAAQQHVSGLFLVGKKAS